MENRDRDKLSKNTDMNRNTSSDIGQQKQKSDFGKKSGSSESIGSGSGRSSGSSGLGDVNRGDMGSNRKPSGGGSSNESL